MAKGSPLSKENMTWCTILPRRGKSKSGKGRRRKVTTRAGMKPDRHGRNRDPVPSLTSEGTRTEGNALTPRTMLATPSRPKTQEHA